MERTTTDTSDTISILIVEDDPIFRGGLRAAFELFHDRVDIVGEAADVEDAVRQVHELIPDLVLLDLRMPMKRGAFSEISWEHGVAAIEQITRIAPHTRILVLSYVLEEPEILFRALRAGAHGYIAKGDRFDGEDLINAIHKIVAGEAIYGPLIAERIRQYHQRDRKPGLPAETLTQREREVLDLLAQRKNNREIAEELVISVKTVKSHVANILAKLHLDSRYEISTYVHLQQAKLQEVGWYSEIGAKRLGW